MRTSKEYGRYLEANAYLNEGLIRREAPALPPAGKPPRVQWMRDFLRQIDWGDPPYPIVHVAGTSGKGSVALMLAEILRGAGLCTGLHLTPYLQVATEKLWVDGRYASAEAFCALVQWARQRARGFMGPDVPMHGVASLAIALEHFRRSQVACAVLEVGVGGRVDLTNALPTRVAVVGPIGLDHLTTLGPRLEDIAWHKAGVIKRGSRAVVLDGIGAQAARRQATEVEAPLRVVGPEDYAAHVDREGQTALDYRGPRLALCGVRLGMGGAHQVQNAALALAAAEELAQIGLVQLDEGRIRHALGRARLPARGERLPEAAADGAPVIIDGAHNPDKLRALGRWLGQHVGPGRAWRALHWVVGSLASHPLDAAALGPLLSAARSFTATEPRVYAKAPHPAAQLAEAARLAGARGVQAEPDPVAALSRARSLADTSDLIVATGSLYLAGELRGLWYPPESILARQRSFWLCEGGYTPFGTNRT